MILCCRLDRVLCAGETEHDLHSRGVKVCSLCTTTTCSGLVCVNLLIELCASGGPVCAAVCVCGGGPNVLAYHVCVCAC